MLKIIVILICLGLQRFFHLGGWFNPSWFEQYLQFIHRYIKKFAPWLALLAIVVPIIIIVALLDLLFSRRFFDLFNLIFAVLFLFFTVDARDLKKVFQNYFNAQKKADAAATALAASEFLDTTVPTNASDLIRAVTLFSFTKTFEQMFVMIFWYMLAGIYGLATYFVITLTQRFALKIDSSWNQLAGLASLIKDILDWLPSRLLGFTFLLTGKFATGSKSFSEKWLKLRNHKTFISEIAASALDISEDPTKISVKENYAALDMINHALIIWIIALLLFSIGRLF